MDGSQSNGLVIFTGDVGPASLRTEMAELAAGSARGRVVQFDVSLGSPPEYAMPNVIAEAVVTAAGARRIFAGGLSLEEHERREALARRTLEPSDIPNEPWRDSFAGYDLREDGAITCSRVSVELGWVRFESGTVDWTRM